MNYLEIPGDKTHELPPLLIHEATHGTSEETSDLDSVMQEAEDMLAAKDEKEKVVEQRKFDLALQLTNQYRSLVFQWQWGDSVLEWIRQCEITFENEATLRHILHPDVWPHASRSGFVTLLKEKAIQTHGITLERAVGLRLTFRTPPPIDCFSNQFLIYLNSSVADSAFQTWSHLTPSPHLLLPPNRFHFDVVDIDS